MSVIPRADNDVYTTPDKRMSQETFLAVGWTLTAVSLLFLVSRLITRVKVIHKLSWDDFFATLAWVISLVYMIMWQIKIPILYWQFDVVSGRVPPTPEFFLAFATFMPFVAGWTLLFYACIWCVKISFLLFFRQLDAKVRTYRICWWMVLLVNLAGFCASVGNIDYRCSSSDLQYIMTECARAERIHFQTRTLYANLTVDVVTDILILSIPIMILWNVQISGRQKAVLYSLFSATTIIMATAIIRVALVKPHPNDRANINVDWLYLWSSVEMTVAIMIACVASFRQLFVGKSNKHLYGSESEKNEASKGWLFSYARLRESLSSLQVDSISRFSRRSSEHASTNMKVQPHDVSTNQIHIEHTVALENVKATDPWKTKNSGFEWSITAHRV